MNWHTWDVREAKPHLALCDLWLALGETSAASRHLDLAEEFTGPQPCYAAIRSCIARVVAEQEARRANQERARAQWKAEAAGGDAEAGIRLVVALLEDGEVERAREFLAGWSGTAADGGAAKIAEGHLQLQLGAPAEAVACFRAAGESERFAVLACVGEAAAWRALGRVRDVEEALLKALALDAGNEEATRALGELYLAERRWDEAQPRFQKLVDRRQNLWPAWLGLGKALLHIGDLTTAIQCYQRAATLSGGHADVRVALGEARQYLTG